MRAFPAVVLLAFTCTPAASKTYSEWKQLSPDGKGGYAIGIIDAFAVVAPEDARWRFDDQEIVRRCFVNKSVTAGMVVDQIDAFYEQNIDKWEYSPAVAFLNRFLVEGGVCSRERNEVKAQ